MDPKLFHHAYALRETEEGTLAERFTQKQFDRFARLGEFFDRNARSTAGVALRFATEAAEIAFEYTLSGLTLAGGGFDVWENGVFTAHIPAEEGRGRAAYRSRFPGASEYCVYLPHTAIAAIRNADLGDYTPVAPFKTRFLFSGDSLTRSAYTPRPGVIFPSALSRQFGADYINRGVGSTKYDLETLDDELRWMPEALFLEYGANDLYQADFRIDGVLRIARDYLEAVARSYPRTKVFVLTPFWNTSYAAFPNRRAASDAYAKELRAIAAACGHIPVDGMTLLSHVPDGVVGDGIHFSEFGSLMLSAALERVVRRYL